MQSRSCSISVCLTLCLVSTGLFNQRATAQTAADNTFLTIEIMLPSITGNLVQAQRWGRVFEKLGETARIRQPLPSDKPEIKETNRGPIRIIKVTGELDRKGNLRFPGRSFTMNDSDLIKAWLDELKVYGAQGSPVGKKFWGLNKEQFDRVVKGVSQPVESATKEKTIKDVLQGLPIEKSLSLVIHPGARADFLKVEESEISQELKGLSSGTALAVILRSVGYGFRPLRTPAGTIELTVQKLADHAEAWPIGWDIDDSTPRNQIVPNLFKFVKTGFEEAPLSRVLEAIAEQTQTPIVIDEWLCQQKEIDVNTIGVSYPEKQTAWSLVLGSVVRQARLTDKIRLDEAGKPFIWVAPFVPYVQKRK